MNNSLNESQLLEKIFPLIKHNDRVLVPPGDDCAVISCGNLNLAITTDQVIENKHYLKDTPPYLVGRKLMARNLSDIAAMGATPLFALVASATHNKNSDWLLEFHRGIIEEGEKFGVTLIGGDLATTPSDTVNSLTLIGSVKNNGILRSSANHGNDLLCTGNIGNSFITEHHLNFIPRIKEGNWLAQYATAMIDITDGFLIDLNRICKASKLSVVVDLNAIPLRNSQSTKNHLKNLLTEGEDYELLVAVPQNLTEEIFKLWPFSTPLTKIGKFSSKLSPGVYNQEDEDLIAKFGTGYDHFS